MNNYIEVEIQKDNLNQIEANLQIKKEEDITT